MRFKKLDTIVSHTVLVVTPRVRKAIEWSALCAVLAFFGAQVYETGADPLSGPVRVAVLVFICLAALLFFNTEASDEQ